MDQQCTITAISINQNENSETKHNHTTGAENNFVNKFLDSIKINENDKLKTILQIIP